MIEIDEVIVTDAVLKEQFVCDLNKCKGACCVEGDLGAPLEEDELEQLDKNYDAIAPYLTAQGRKEIELQGKYIMDWEDEYSTPTLDGKECAYAVWDDRGILGCGIEKAHIDGKLDFKKPISCHLYPIRVSKLSIGTALNYDEWDICSDACTLGKELKVPVYKFLKAPLIRMLGEEWYEKLEGKVIADGNKKSSE